MLLFYICLEGIYTKSEAVVTDKLKWTENNK